MRSSPWVQSLIANPSAAILGTILADAVIAGTDERQPAWTTFVVTAITLVVFWLTHIYTQAIGQHLRARGRPVMALRTLAGHELAVIEGGVPTLILLALGALHLLEEDLAVNLAMWAGVAALFGWGALAGYRRDPGWKAPLLAGALGGVLGVFVVVLKALVH